MGAGWVSIRRAMVLPSELSTGLSTETPTSAGVFVCLADDSAAETNRHGMGAGARLELREEVPHVRLHRLLGQEQPNADLPVHDAVRDQLQHLDLAHPPPLLQLAEP